jgi:sRNA-binding carbon storage regulator CsrA
MLVLKRRVGESVCIGDAVWVCVFAAKRDRILIAVLAPSDMDVRNDSDLAPSAIYDLDAFGAHQRLSLFSVGNGESFAVGAAVFSTTFGRSALPAFVARPKRVQFAIAAPLQLAVHREEVRQRIDAAAGATQPAVPFAQRLRQAKASPVRPCEAPMGVRAVAAAARAPANAEFVFA